MLECVNEIHEKRIIHADLKPANFLFVQGRLKLIDFGISKVINNVDSTQIFTNSQEGTYNYMSPECFTNQIPFNLIENKSNETIKVDIYLKIDW